MGYINLVKGLRHLDAWVARMRPPVGDQLARLARALDLPEEQVLAMIRADADLVAAEARAARRQDPTYHLVMRMMAGVYAQQKLPGDLTLDQALERAATTARERSRRCCLNTPDDLCYWLAEDGSIETVTQGGRPYMQI